MGGILFPSRSAYTIEMGRRGRHPSQLWRRTPSSASHFSAHDFLRHVSVDVGQAKIAPGVIEGQAFVIKA
jgi:hypothetical protein